MNSRNFLSVEQKTHPTRKTTSMISNRKTSSLFTKEYSIKESYKKTDMMNIEFTDLNHEDNHSRFSITKFDKPITIFSIKPNLAEIENGSDKNDSMELDPQDPAYHSDLKKSINRDLDEL